MFKALLAASIAMLACCAAAVFAGPTPPAFGPDPARVATAPDAHLEPLPLDLLALSQPDQDGWAPIAATTDFMPVQLTSAHGVTSPYVSPEDAPIAPPLAAQPAVIPLPSPLYAAVALLAIALIARRLMLRAC